MSGIKDPVLFALAIIALLGVPGPTNTLLATAGATAGLRSSIRLVPVETLGYLVAISLYELVLGPLVLGSPILFTILRLVVSSYLLWVTYELWSGSGIKFVADAPLVTRRKLFVATVLNPKGSVLALAIIPFDGRATFLYLLAFTGLAATLAAGWIGIGATIGTTATASRQRHLVPRAGALVLGIFALLFASSVLMR